MKIFFVALAIVSFIGLVNSQYCSTRKSYDTTTNSCKCDLFYTAPYCVGLEVYTDATCCNCPYYNTEPAIPHPINTVWSQADCNFVCPAASLFRSCGAGSVWNTPQCKCIAVPSPPPAPVIITTNNPPSGYYACALWTRYLGDNAPSINGFSAGTSVITNTAAYVGKGMYKDHNGAARIQIETTTIGTSPKTPGGYITYTGAEVQVPFPEYLVVPTGCTCSWVPVAQVFNRPLVFTGDYFLNFAVGRKVFADGTVAISKVARLASSPNFNFQLFSPTSTTEASAPATELLVCETTASTADRPIVTFATEACGMWSTIGWQNTAATNGFAAGPSILTTATYSSTSYIGRGQELTWYAGGRYQVESPAGTYTTLGGKYSAVDYGSEFLIVPQGCTCEWMAPALARTYKGLITIPDSTSNYMVGRKTLSNGIVSPTYVNNVAGNGNADLLQWYAKTDKTEGTDTATEVLVCETRPTACALWTRYLGDDAPSINGFSAGTSVISNTIAYVGKGMYKEHRGAARIQIEATTIGTSPNTPGGYISYNGTEVQVPFAEYLVVPSGCTCSWVRLAQISNRPLVFTGDAGFNFAVGRKVLADGTVAVSKVVRKTGLPNFNQHFYAPTSTSELVGNANELLICETTASTVDRPTVTFANEACGMWSTIGWENTAATNGFSAGPSILTTASFSSTSYIGRGQELSWFAGGRYQAEYPAGTYTSLGGKYSAVDYGSEFLIVPQGCTCQWMAPALARTYKGLITIPDYTSNYMVGRETFFNGIVSVSYVNNVAGNGKADLLQWYAKIDKTEGTNNATEVLVCSKTTTPAPTTTTTPTPPPGPYACALWTKYLGDDAPSVNGFSAGVSPISNAISYVGKGMYENHRGAVRIQTVTTSIGTNPKTPGGYISYKGVEVQVPFAEYLVVPKGCTCSWVPLAQVSNRPLVFTGDAGYNSAVGRKVYADGKVAITKVIRNSASQYFNLNVYAPTSTTEVLEAATELLVCETSVYTADRPIVTFVTEACGMWSTIGWQNTAATNGFAAGPSILSNATFSSTSYIGRGQKLTWFAGGRYQVESPAGVYTTLGGKYSAVDYGSEFLIVPKNCVCQWMAPAVARTYRGLITIPDYTSNYLVGRRTFFNGLISPSYVNNVANNGKPDLFEWYANIDKTEGTGTATEVLVCSTTFAEPLTTTTTTLAPTTTTTTPTTTTTTTTLPPPGPYACGLWMRYLGDNAPSVNGFSAGTSVITNTTTYVGRGMYKSHRAAARIQIEATPIGTEPKTPGGYISYNAVEVQVNFAEYLVVPSGCTCSWVPLAQVLNRPVVFTGDPTYDLAIGRRVFGDGTVSITKVVRLPGSPLFNQQWFASTPTIQLFGTASELLVCETTVYTADRPIATFATEACGMWSTIGWENTAATNGFAAGPSILSNATFSSTSYIGRGQKLSWFAGGSYQVESPAGVYTSLGGKFSAVDYGSEFLIVPQGCICQWMAPALARTYKGLITIPDSTSNYMVGRKTLSNGTVSPTYVNNVAGNGNADLLQWYANIDKTEGTDTATEVLVCLITSVAPTTTTTTQATTTTTTLPPPVPVACALWTRYNSDTSPSVNGLLAGISVVSNSTVYVGKAMYGTQRAAARIQIATTTVGTSPKTPGAYISYGGKEIIAPYAEYLVVPTGCICSWVPVAQVFNRPLVFTGDSDYNFTVGRKVFADGKVAITKVSRLAGSPTFFNKQWYAASSTSEPFDTATELLVCETTASTAGRPKVPFATEVCGMWSTIGWENTAATNGFPVGPSILNNATYSAISYVGRGQKGGGFVGGRYQVESPNVVFTSAGSKYSAVDYGSEFLIVPQGCTCQWIAPATARTYNALVTIPDYLFNYMVGRKTFANGLVSVSHVNSLVSNGNADLLQWYAGLDKIEGADTATEVLVCSVTP